MKKSLNFQSFKNLHYGNYECYNLLNIVYDINYNVFFHVNNKIGVNA